MSEEISLLQHTYWYTNQYYVLIFVLTSKHYMLLWVVTYCTTNESQFHCPTIKGHHIKSDQKSSN